MKQISKILVRVAVVIVLFTGTTLTLSTAGVQTVSEAKAAVKSEDVTNYLTGLGYEIIDLKPIEGTDNWESHTILDGVYYLTTVYVRGTAIVDHADVIM
jgi:hypothetical protein